MCESRALHLGEFILAYSISKTPSHVRNYSYVKSGVANPGTCIFTAFFSSVHGPSQIY